MPTIKDSTVIQVKEWKANQSEEKYKYKQEN